jgi:hypothetical protein
MKALFLAATVLLVAALPALAQGFTDPVPYCQAIGTIDSPDARYTGPKLPAWMAAKLHLEPSQAKSMALCPGRRPGLPLWREHPLQRQGRDEPRADGCRQPILPGESRLGFRAHVCNRP